MAEFSLRDAVVFGTAISPPLQQTLFRLWEDSKESDSDDTAYCTLNIFLQLADAAALVQKIVCDLYVSIDGVVVNLGFRVSIPGLVTFQIY